MMSLTQRTPVVVQSSKTLLNCVEKAALRPGPAGEMIRGAGEKVHVALESTVESLGEAGQAFKDTLMTGISKVTEVGSTGKALETTAELDVSEVKQIGKNVAEGFKGFFPTSLGQTEENARGTAEQKIGQVKGVAANQLGSPAGILAEELEASEALVL
ncbi:unnamed protein product [Cylicocyclus nassatus]|uniref:Uncharacterized protein n=1 Tax=Cylicocyclus nassatus TaxID=53992 RepID=A0AA36HBH8_CYLNA|nr:unnamed protein product [Cylicocyclus nassatus]